MNRHKYIFAFCACLGLGCNPRSNSTSAKAAPEQEQRPIETSVKEEKSPSDLDRPAEDLFSEQCEHDKKTFECDECRYSVGVVRAPACLVSEGLIKTGTVKKERVEAPMSLTGEVRFDERRVTHLSSPAEGIIRKVFVMLGDKVSAGQKLIEIESVTVGEAESAFLEAQATLQLSRRSYDRQAELHKESISSEREYLQAKQRLEAAEIRARSALAKLTRLGIPMAEAQSLTQQNSRARMVLQAPTSGTVLKMHAVPGESAKSEESLLTLGDVSTLWVWADLYERDVARVMEAKERGPINALVSVRAFPNETFSGAVNYIGPVMDEASRTLKMRVEVKNPTARLLAGMFAIVKLYLPGDDHVLALPSGAVLADEGRSFVFLHHQGDYYLRRPVSTGRTWNDWVEITKGLSGGETVVVDGAFLLKSDVLRSKMGAGCAD